MAYCSTGIETLTRRIAALLIVIVAAGLAVSYPLIASVLSSSMLRVSNSNSVGHKTTNGPIVNSTSEITFHTIVQDSPPSEIYVTPENLVINDQGAWSRVWDRMQASCVEYCPAVPNVDFSSRTILAVFLGEEATGGYYVNIVRVEQTRLNITVYSEVTEPGSGCAVAEWITYPFYIIDIPKSEANVTFTFHTSYHNCS